MAAHERAIDMSDLKDLEPLSQRLKAATEELNQALATIEERLNALGVGVEVTLEDRRQELERSVIQLDEGDREVEVARLGYGRYGSTWSLLVTRVKWRETGEFKLEYSDDHISIGPPVPAHSAWLAMSHTPLLRSARELRVKAVERIPALIDAIKAEAEKLTASVEAAKKIAAALE